MSDHRHGLQKRVSDIFKGIEIPEDVRCHCIASGRVLSAAQEPQAIPEPLDREGQCGPCTDVAEEEEALVCNDDDIVRPPTLVARAQEPQAIPESLDREGRCGPCTDADDEDLMVFNDDDIVRPPTLAAQAIQTPESTAIPTPLDGDGLCGPCVAVAGDGPLVLDDGIMPPVPQAPCPRGMTCDRPGCAASDQTKASMGGRVLRCLQTGGCSLRWSFLGRALCRCPVRQQHARNRD